MRRIFIAFALIAIPAAGEAQSWCSSSRLNPTERTICSDRILGELDAELGALFARVGAGRRAEQNAWLRNERDACGTNIICIEDAYIDRIDVLNGRRLGGTPLAAQRRPWCGAARLNPTEATICADDTLADHDAAMEAVYGALRADPSDRSQIDWLREDRDACGTDLACISASYLRRIIVLGGRLRGQ